MEPRAPKPAPSVKRRDLLKQIAAAAVAGGAAVGAAKAQTSGDVAVSAADVETVAKAAGRTYTPTQREMMARGLTRKRAAYRALRKAALTETDEPAIRFDPVLPGTRVPTGESSLRVSRGEPRRFSQPEELAFATVVELSRLLKARRITSTALTRMYLERLKRLGPRLHAVVTLTEGLALEQAARADREIAAGRYRGPLHGIPWGAKDLFATRGIPTTWGARPYERQTFDYDATVVRRLEEAGAVLVAKLSMGELAMGDVWFGGVTRNPWRAEMGSSGSSAGSGSATAAGLVGFSLGTETLGSIVSPSVRNGVTGLRPTFGLVPRYGAMALCWTLDKIGPMCRAVEDCALVLGAIHGPDGRDATAADVPFRWSGSASLRGLRVGYDEAAFAEVRKDAKRRALYENVLETLGGLGLELRAVKLPLQTEAFGAVVGTILDAEAAAAFLQLTESGGVDQLTRQTEGSWPNIFRVGTTVPAVEYLQALRVRRQIQRAMADALQDVDLYVTVPFLGPSLVYTNLTGHPSLVTRCGMLEGLPQSVEFIGGLYREEALLRVGLAYERAVGPAHWPDTERLPLVPPAA